MSKHEFERAVLLRKVHEKRLTQRKAAEVLQLSLRQVERLCQRYRTEGPAALASRRRGRASNHQLPVSLRASVLEVVRGRYADFGPTLAREKLVECHGLRVSRETLRKWMTEDGLWVPHARRRDRVHQPRNRRACLGTLVAPSRIVRTSGRGYNLRLPNPYCAPLATVFGEAALQRAVHVDDVLRLVSEDDDRYVTLNIKRLSDIGTIEVRMHSGTVEARKILMWVSLWQQILWAATHRRNIESARGCKVLKPDGDIIALAMRYLPEARQVQQRAFLRRLAERREEVVRGLWAPHPTLKPWLRYQRKWVTFPTEEA